MNNRCLKDEKRILQHAFAGIYWSECHTYINPALKPTPDELKADYDLIRRYGDQLASMSQHGVHPNDYECLPITCDCGCDYVCPFLKESE